MWTLWNIYSCGSCGGNYGSLFNPIKYAAGGTFGTIGQYAEKLSFLLDVKIIYKQKDNIIFLQYYI